MFDEKELVRKILNGDLRSFDILVKQYEKLVCHVVCRLIDEKESVEDISQEIFLKVYKGLRYFTFQSKLSTWIARIAYTASINYLKKHKRNPNLALPEDMDQMPMKGDDPEKMLTQKEITELIHRQIWLMPIPYRTVLTLYHLEEFSYREIAEITGLPEGTVKTNLFRARNLLKEKLSLHLKIKTK